ncbi:hypothetical protein HZA75_07480 [Candidatus Roizmanbacteria bacterium]|nr:hypothetical protein [Candidatus Roizmanbacteria bacterium]
MLEDYKATKEDFEAIEEGIKTVWRPELDLIFERKYFLKNIIIVSYDSFFIYLWTKLYIPHLDRLFCELSDYYAYKIPHKIKLEDEWQRGWRACFPPESLDKLFPKRLCVSQFKTPKISGGLFTSFIELQKNKNIEDNPYITYESYLATIVHEFAHIYWNQRKLCWYSNKKENINFLRMAKQLYEGKGIKKIIYFPMDRGVSELYAFCAEYSVSELFWPNHKQNLDNFIQKRLEKLIKEEQLKDLDREDSVLAPSRYPHDFAFVFGKIILANYPKSWPKILTNRKLLYPSPVNK